MSCDMLASIWPKYLNLVHQTVSRACRYGLGTRLRLGPCGDEAIYMGICCRCTDRPWIDSWPKHHLLNDPLPVPHPPSFSRPAHATGSGVESEVESGQCRPTTPGKVEKKIIVAAVMNIDLKVYLKYVSTRTNAGIVQKLSPEVIYLVKWHFVVKKSRKKTMSLQILHA